MAIATLTALHDTAIKKSTEQSSKLPDTEKKRFFGLCYAMDGGYKG